MINTKAYADIADLSSAFDDNFGYVLVFEVEHDPKHLLLWTCFSQ